MVSWLTSQAASVEVWSSNSALGQIFVNNFSSVCFFPRTFKWRFQISENEDQLVDELDEDVRAA